MKGDTRAPKGALSLDIDQVAWAGIVTSRGALCRIFAYGVLGDTPVTFQCRFPKTSESVSAGG